MAACPLCRDGPEYRRSQRQGEAAAIALTGSRAPVSGSCVVAAFRLAGMDRVPACPRSCRVRGTTGARHGSSVLDHERPAGERQHTLPWRRPMTTTHRSARLTGLAYLVLAISGIVGFLLVRPQLYVPDDAMRTAANLVAHEGLARLGIAADLVTVLSQALAAVGFFLVFRRVNSAGAASITAFGLVNSAVVLVATAFSATALQVALRGGPTSASDSPHAVRPQRRHLDCGRPVLRAVADSDGMAHSALRVHAPCARLDPCRRRGRLHPEHLRELPRARCLRPRCVRCRCSPPSGRYGWSAIC